MSVCRWSGLGLYPLQFRYGHLIKYLHHVYQLFIIFLFPVFASLALHVRTHREGCVCGFQLCSKLYVENVMSFVRKLKLEQHWTFQQDIDIKHTSDSTKAWLQKKSWKILQWPSQSADLKLTEHLWWDLKKVVEGQTKNITDLETVAHEELRFLSSAARTWCLAMHLICCITAKGCPAKTKDAYHEGVQ